MHFPAANKGTAICHVKKSAPIDNISMNVREEKTSSQASQLPWSKTTTHLLNVTELCIQCRNTTVGVAKHLKWFSFFWHLEALQMVQFITHSTSPFAVRAAFWCYLSLLPITSRKSSIFPRLLRWRLQLPHFCNHTSLQIFVPLLKENKFILPKIKKYFLWNDKKLMFLLYAIILHKKSKS